MNNALDSIQTCSLMLELKDQGKLVLLQRSAKVLMFAEVKLARTVQGFDALAVMTTSLHGTLVLH